MVLRIVRIDFFFFFLIISDYCPADRLINAFCWSVVGDLEREVCSLRQQMLRVLKLRF